MPDIQVPNPADVEATKAKQFTRRVALATGIMAVVLAVAALGGSNAMKDMIISTQQASNQWAYFQAKYAREHLYDVELQKLELTKVAGPTALSAAALAQIDALKAKWTGLSKKYAKDRDKITKDAKKLEADAELARARDPYFDYAGVLLQIAIIMASIAMLAESRAVYRFSLIAAILGAIFTLNGFFLFVKIPIFH